LLGLAPVASAFVFSSLPTNMPLMAQEQAAKEDEELDFELTPAQVVPMLRAGKTDLVIKKLDAALEKNPLDATLLSVELQVASMLMGTKPDAAEPRLLKLIDKIKSSVDADEAALNVYLSALLNYSNVLARKGTVEEALKLIDEGEAKVAGKNLPASNSLVMTKARFLSQLGRDEEARDVFQKSYAKIRESLSNEANAINSLAGIAMSFDSALGEKFADDAKALMVDVKGLVRERLASEKVVMADIQAFLSLEMTEASKLMYSDAAKAKEQLEQLKKELEANIAKLPEEQQKAMERSLSMIDQRIDMVESGIRREKLIGTAAPEYDAEEFVGMDAKSLRDLKGKVVLLDFWAVWCGPCIATFPHLQHLQESYGDKGLVILGITKPYSYKWNEEAQRAERAEEVAMEDEMAMLNKFREHHKLQHGFVVTAKDSGYSKALEVTGIPQAVVVDKQGVIRLIKVGSGDQNAKDIEETIKQLLAE
jgi:thiol-disulfide isomerase/thioredoxin